jgi:maleylpyruvate isomerase
VIAISEGQARQLQEAVAQRSEQIVVALSGFNDDRLGAASALPGWSRLTIACHLRYGAEALFRMTEATLAGRPASYYPEGRARQRPGSLVPHEGERAPDVVASLEHHATALSRVWSTLSGEAWERPVLEPADNADLGPVTLGRLLLLRLTEVEVHGSDLAVGLPDWSDLFVRVALPMRVDWVRSRRANHREVATDLEGTWLLAATDGPSYRVSVTDLVVESEVADPALRARATIEASSRDLLALLLGRPFVSQPRLIGDVAFGEAFSAAFPGP